MSRSAFASRFVELVGETPMGYLSRWRLNRAALWLRSSDSTLAQAATRVGYESKAAMSRAFKRCFGLSPAPTGVRACRSGSKAVLGELHHEYSLCAG